MCSAKHISAVHKMASVNNNTCTDALTHCTLQGNYLSSTRRNVLGVCPANMVLLCLFYERPRARYTRSVPPTATQKSFSEGERCGCLPEVHAPYMPQCAWDERCSGPRGYMHCVAEAERCFGVRCTLSTVTVAGVQKGAHGGGLCGRRNTGGVPQHDQNNGEQNFDVRPLCGAQAHNVSGRNAVGAKRRWARTPVGRRQGAGRGGTQLGRS